MLCVVPRESAESKRSSMEMAKRTTALEIMMYSANIIFWVSGAVSVAVALWLRQERIQPLVGALDGHFLGGYTALAAAGLGVCLVGFLGFTAVISERSRLAFAYALLVAVFFALYLAIAGWSFACLGVVDKVVADEFPASMASYANSKRVQVAVDTVQRKMKCCGLHGPHDWKRTSWAYGRTDDSVPDSCCSVVPEFSGCGIRTEDKSWAAFSGCQVPLRDALQENLRNLAVMATTFSSVMACVLIICTLYWRHVSRGLHLIYPQSTVVVTIQQNSDEPKGDVDDDIALEKATLKKQLELEDA